VQIPADRHWRCIDPIALSSLDEQDGAALGPWGPVLSRWKWGVVMPLHVSRFERYSDADRDQLGVAALEWCRSARESEGVTSCRYYWIDPNQIAIVTDAEPGAWGPGAAPQPNARYVKAMFSLADLARNTSSETWADARAGSDVRQLAG